MDSTSKKYYKISEVAEMVDCQCQHCVSGRTSSRQSIHAETTVAHDFILLRDIEAIRMISYLVKDKGMKLEAAQEELKRNRDGITKKFETVQRLRQVRDRLQEMLDSLHHLR